jgi:glycerol-3-phosphate acyltransferase PlsY
VLTILADVGKGVLAILLAQSLGVGQTGVYLAGLACALGHDFMPLLGFRGGQGMAVIVGAGAMLYPRELALAVVSFLILWGITRIMDIGFGVGAVWYTHPAADVIFLIALIPTIGIKKLWDRPAAREIAWHGNGDNPERPGLRR